MKFRAHAYNEYFCLAVVRSTFDRPSVLSLLLLLMMIYKYPTRANNKTKNAQLTEKENSLSFIDFGKHAGIYYKLCMCHREADA